MTKIKLLNNRSRILKELLHRININNDICLEIDLSKEETLYLKLNINSYRKQNPKKIISSRKNHLSKKTSNENSNTLAY